MVREIYSRQTQQSLISSPKTEETGLDVSKRNYENGARKLVFIIKQISDLSIPEKTVDDWKILLVSIRVVDDKLDHIIETEERLKFAQKIISFLRGEIVDFSSDKDLEKAMLDTRNLSEG